ncbi:MAG: hypothetical protein WC882_05405 [Candidatus Gracilibacteria bacterium]
MSPCKFLAKISVTSLLLTLVLSIPTTNAALAFPCSAGTDINSGSVTEPSDAIVYDGQLWIVSDDGYLWKMGLDGSDKFSYYIGGDLEGLTVNRETGLLYAGKEEPNTIIEINPTTGTATGNEWYLGDYMVSESSNQGLEALTYAEGYFYAGLQYNGDVYVFETGEQGSVRLVSVIDSPLGYTDIAGLYYEEGVFYTVYDYYDSLALFEVDDYENPTTWTLLNDASGSPAEYDLGEGDQEAVALDGTTLYIGDDPNTGSGEIWEYTSFPSQDNRTDYSQVVSWSTDTTKTKTVTITYASGDTQTLSLLSFSTPFKTIWSVRAKISSDGSTIAILNGPNLRVYKNGELILLWMFVPGCS